MKAVSSRQATGSAQRSSPSEIALRSGTLRVSCSEVAGDWPLDRLCGFASRRNPKRGFLIVSKVLGRHIPARPAEMREAARALAARIPADLPQPTLVIGLAETAVGLGQTLFAEMLAAGREAAYLPTTRQRVAEPLLCRFEEPHSHASAHLLYRPAQIDLGRMASLVLVDDEVSTGTTLSNLASALIPSLPACREIVVATLTDWSGGGAWLERMPRPARCVALLHGRLDWEPGPRLTDDAHFAAFDDAAATLGILPNAGTFGRTGTRTACDFSLPDARALDLPDGAALRIVGTGEFTYPPFLVAERLEQAGHDVVVQATSRSPVYLGGAIASALCFGDNYGTGVPNYLYNAAGEDGRVSLICHETPPHSIDHRLVDALCGITVHFGGAIAADRTR